MQQTVSPDFPCTCQRRTESADEPLQRTSASSARRRLSAAARAPPRDGQPVSDSRVQPDARPWRHPNHHDSPSMCACSVTANTVVSKPVNPGHVTKRGYRYGEGFRYSAVRLNMTASNRPMMSDLARGGEWICNVVGDS